MDNKANDPKGSVTLWSEKSYTQSEVDDLLEERDDSLSSRQREIEGEFRSADKQIRLENRTVANLVNRSNRILVSISTHIFPFNFFPDTINIEEGRLTIITRTFFASSQVHSVDIKDISNVFINTAPFYAQLVIVSKTFTENEIRINYLRRGEAVFARRIIEGLRIFDSEQIDTSNYTKEELITKLKELSTTGIVT